MVGGEDLGLLDGDGGISLDEGSHHTTGSLDTEGERSNVEEQQALSLLRGVTGENGGQDGSTVSDGFIGIDTQAELLSVEEVGDELDDPWDAGRTADQDHLVHVGLVDLRITEDLLDGVESVGM